jgi:HSP20 family protein
MANLTRSNPSDEMVSLREAMDRLFAESFVLPHAMRTFFSRGPAEVNLCETPDSYEIHMPFPGAKPEDVTITAQGDTVTLKWETKAQPPKDSRQVWSGMRYGEFQQSFTLPSDINADAAEAHLSDGVLSIYLPKVESAKATSIKIKSEQAQQQKLEVGQASSLEQGT